MSMMVLLTRAFDRAINDDKFRQNLRSKCWNDDNDDSDDTNDDDGANVDDDNDDDAAHR